MVIFCSLQNENIIKVDSSIECIILWYKLNNVTCKVYILRIRNNALCIYIFFNLPQPFYPYMVAKCDLCNMTFGRPIKLRRHVRITRITHETLDMHVELPQIICTTVHTYKT